MQALRLECIDLLVEMEARLDFDDEMPSLDTGALVTRIETMCQRLQQALTTAGRGRLLQSGLQVRISAYPHDYFYFRVKLHIFSLIKFSVVGVKLYAVGYIVSSLSST